MRGPWRYLVLMLAPAMLRSLFFINGLQRTFDAPCEPLIAVLLALGIGGIFFVINARLAAHLSCRKPELSVIDYVTTALLMIVPGAMQAAGIPGPWMGAAEIFIAAGSAAWVLHGWPVRSSRERCWRLIGVLLSPLFYQHFILINKMYFLELMFFWGGELLLIGFLLASPATLRGDRKNRWKHRIAILLIFFAAIGCRPDYLYAPWSQRPECMGEHAVWTATEVMPYGSHFSWGPADQGDCDALFDTRGRMAARATPDADMISAIPGLLALGGTNFSSFLLAVGEGSVFLSALASSAPVGITYVVPFVWAAQLPDPRLGVRIYDVDKLSSARINSVLVILSVPAYPEYAGFVTRWLDQLTSSMLPDAVAAIPERLLRSPVLWKYFHERFLWHGVLPGANRLWIFSNQPRDLTPAVLDRKLNENFGEDSPLPPGVYEYMVSSGQQLPPPPSVTPEMFLGPAQWHALDWNGWRDWRWYAAGAILLILWRILRLFAERRGSGYRYWNLAESSFAAFSLYFLWMTLAVSEFGASSADAFLWSVIPAAMMLTNHLRKIRYSRLLLGIALVICLLTGLMMKPCGWMLAVFAVNAWFSGVYFARSLETPALFREELSATGSGVVLAAGFMALAMALEAPAGAVLTIILAARLPMIWQLRRKRVY